MPGMEGANENKSIVIHDPVAKADYVIEVQNKIARKVIVGDAAKITTFNGGNVMFNRREGRPAGGPEEGTQEVVMNKAGDPEEKMNVLKSAPRAKIEAEVQHPPARVPPLA